MFSESSLGFDYSERNNRPELFHEQKNETIVFSAILAAK